MDGKFSIVQYVSEQEKHKCGYCKQLKSSACYGMWAHSLTVQDYQELIDRGWRRSGKYCYKPIMDITCCPMYTIRCEALRIKLTKSQKKIIKRVNKFLAHGDKDRNDEDLEPNFDDHNEGQSALESFNALIQKPIAIDTRKINTNIVMDMSGSGENASGNFSGADVDIRYNPVPEKPKGKKSKCNKKQRLGDSADKRKPVTENISVSLPKPEETNNLNDCQFAKIIDEDNQSFKQDSQFAKNIDDGNQSFKQDSQSAKNMDDDNQSFKQGEGMDQSRPPCKKAKLIRIEKKRQKLAAAGLEFETIVKQNKPTNGKSLEQFLLEIPPNAQHQLKISLVSTSAKSEEWVRTCKISHDVYVKYQMAIHGSTLEQCSERQFNRFLVDTPLQIINTVMSPTNDTFKLSAALYKKYQMAIHGDTAEDCGVDNYREFLVDTPIQPFWNNHGPLHGYGSFHQQYWFDDKLIAVGVIDILPKCVSSVYFFYDPDYSNLSLGTYGSLRELYFTQELHKVTPEVEYYYMGYYIHSCPKMRYKSNLNPSYLLCPETYTWFAIEQCLAKINIDAYARFNDDASAKDAHSCSSDDIKSIPVLCNYNVYKYGQYQSREGNSCDNEMLEYGNLVGKRCATRMIFVKD